MDLPEAGENVVALDEIKRGDDLRPFEELVEPVLHPKIAAFDQFELLVEFFLQLVLPLEAEVGGADDQKLARLGRGAAIP